MKRHDTPTASGRLPAALLLLLLALSGPPLRSYTVVTNPLAVTLGVNHSPPRPVAILRSIRMPREFVTHDPDFEIIASNSLHDEFKQRELMDHVAEIVIPVLPSGHGQLRARIVETHMFNETMGWVDLGSNSTLCLRLWQRSRDDCWPDAQNYYRVWLEASTSGPNGSYTPLADDWSYTNRDIIIEIYHNNDKLTQLPIKLKSLMTLSYPSIEIISNMVSPVIFNPYASDADMEFDFHLLNVFEDAQQGYGLKIKYQLSETVIAGGNGTGGNFFVIQDIDGDAGTHIPSVDQNLLLKTSSIIPFYTPAQTIKWEGFTQTISGEDASAIWIFPNEGKDNNGFASPANVAKEGRYKIILGCTDRFYANQKQTIQFAVEVGYALSE